MSDLRFDPFAELSTYHDAMRQLIEGGWLGPRDLLPTVLASGFVPVDMLETGQALIVRAAMPGVKIENLTITVLRDTLTLRGEVKADTEFEGATYLLRERRVTAFTRSLNLPMAVDVDHAGISFRDGVLTLTLTKSESVQPKLVQVTAA